MTFRDLNNLRGQNAAMTTRLALTLSFPTLLLLLSCGTPSTPPPDTATQLNEVHALLDSWQGDPRVLEQARLKLETIFSQSPDSAPAYREYARYHMKAGYRNYNNVDPKALAAAEAALQRAVELDPKYSDAYVLAGHLYFLKGDHQRAHDALDRALALGSKDPWLYLNRADIFIDEGKLDVAEALYRHVIDGKSTDTNVMEAAYSGLIGCYRRTNRDADADKGYQELIAYAPGVAWYNGNYATFLLCRMDRDEAAISQFGMALNKMSYGMAESGFAAALYRKWARKTVEGDKVQAAAALGEAQYLRPGDPVEIYKTYCRSSGGSAVDEIGRAVKLSGLSTTPG